MEDNNQQLFSPNKHQKNNDDICPECGGALQIKNGKYGPFLGCENYPTCEYIKNLGQSDGHIIKELNLKCPLCAKTLVIRSGKYGMYISCCDYPNCTYTQSTQEQVVLDLTCPLCKTGRIIQKTNRFGKDFYTCDNYPQCNFVVNYKPVAGTCSLCDFPLLVKRKKNNKTILECADKKCQHKQ